MVTLDKIDCIIDGLRVKRVGGHTFSVVQRFVDDILTLPDREIFDAMIWIMSHCKLVVKGAATAPASRAAAWLDQRFRPDTGWWSC